MNTNGGLTYRSLDRQEIDAVLARNDVGRIAYVRADHIDIEPVHYVYANGWLYGRTSPGKELEMNGSGWWPVAFEVDEVADARHLRSVVVHGGFYTLDPHGSDWEREEATKAAALVRMRLPDTFPGGEATPGRNVLFRVAVQEVTGRESMPAEAALASPTASPG